MRQITVARLQPGEGSRYRALRLRALLDAPDAFGGIWTDEQAFAPEVWEGRLLDPEGAVFAGVLDGADMGLARGGRYGSQAGLYSMWTDPAARGTGLADALVRAVIDWAAARGDERILLDVGDANARAIALYGRHGFQATGETGALPPPREHIREHQRARRLVLPRQR